MSEIIETLKNAPEYIGGAGRVNMEIKNAEKLLGIEFAPDYKCYLKEIGLACFNGHELTGICKDSRLNVVDVTAAQRKQYPEACLWYVIEETNIDGIVIWQSPAGAIYKTILGTKTQKICDSMTEYIKNIC